MNEDPKKSNISTNPNTGAGKSPQNSADKESKQKVFKLLAVEAGFEFAFLIAVPLVAGILAGKWLDTKTNHHFFVVIGILLGLAVTAIAVYKRILDYKNLLK